MKTTNSTLEASAPANVRPSSVSKTSKAVNAKTSAVQQSEFIRHCANRRLSTEAVLNYLQRRLPQQYDLANAVGKWVWLDVLAARKPGLARLLWA